MPCVYFLSLLIVKENEINTPNTGLKPVSYIWMKLLQENPIPGDGIVVEVAPGYEKKIGDALALLDFKGTIILIEPDGLAAKYTQQLYRSIMPQADIRVVMKPLQEIEVGKDIPGKVDALLANHPFDDMAIAFAMHDKGISLFSQEKEEGAHLSPYVKELYDAVSDKDYIGGILATINTWKNFIKKLRPDLFIVSQYPSHKLILKQLNKRQNSGLVAIELIRYYYESYLKKQYQDRSFGQQGDPAWWIIARRPYVDLDSELAMKPAAMQRLGESIFVSQQAKQLESSDYDVVYVDDAYFRNANYSGDVDQMASKFAIALVNDSHVTPQTITVYADRQKDSSGIGLEGNLGSGRAVYYGKQYNVMGVGKTTLCTSTVPSHSTGKMELVGALRRVIISRWISRFTGKVVQHPVVIALKETAQFKWASQPIPLALLVRVDNGDLDRPSHIEYSPEIKNDFYKSLAEYAKLDAQYFAYRIMLGAWSTSNYSLDGHVIDLESASFVKYRGPYNTSSGKYPHTHFGYEGLGFVNILEQMARVKSLEGVNIKNLFYQERRKNMAVCLLSLLGIDSDYISDFLSRHLNRVMELADQFEQLAKKISPQKTSLNLYNVILEDADPCLLDMSRLFRNLKKIYESSSNKEEKALSYLIRKEALKKIVPGLEYKPQLTDTGETNQGEMFLKEQAVVTHNKLENFLSDTRKFICDLLQLLEQLDVEGCLPREPFWDEQLRLMNHDFPTLDALNTKLKYWVEEYRTGEISPKTLGIEIEKLCQLPDYPIGEDFNFTNIPIFNYLKLTDYEQQILSLRIKRVDYKKDSIIINQNDSVDSLFILVQGICQMSENGFKTSEISDRGTLIGESVVFGNDMKATANVIAETPVRLLQIHKYDLERLTTIYPRLRRLIMNMLIQKREGVQNNVIGLKIFQGIDPEDIRLFLADKAVKKTFHKGDKFIVQGKKTLGIHVLIQGSVTLSQSSTGLDKDAIELNDVPSTQGLFGDRSVILDQGANCTITASEDIVTLFINEKDFRALLDRYPQLLRNCRGHIADYDRDNSERANLVANIEKKIRM